MNTARTRLCIDADNLADTDVRTQANDHNPDGLMAVIEFGGITIQTYGIEVTAFADWLEHTATQVRLAAIRELRRNEPPLPACDGSSLPPAERDVA